MRQARDAFGPPPVTARAALTTSSGGSAIAASWTQVAQRPDCRTRSVVHTCRPQYPHAARCATQALLPHTGHSSTSSEAKNAMGSSAQPARCLVQTRRRDASVWRKCREQCTCPSTAHTA